MQLLRMRLSAVIIAGTAAAFSFSCSRDKEYRPTTTPVVAQRQELGVEDGRLVFSSKEVFAKFIESQDLVSISKLEDFDSMSEVFPAKSKNGREEGSAMPIPNAFLSKLVNADGVLQVQNWIIRINVADSLVTVLDEKYKEQYYRDLVNEVTRPEIYRFKTTDDVLYLLADGYTTSPDFGGMPNGRMKLFCCCGASTGQTEDAQPVPPDNNANYSYLMTAYNTYEAYGVYFEASTRIVYKTAPLFVGPSVISGELNLYYYFKQKCSSPRTESKSEKISFVLFPTEENNNQFAFKRMIYSSTTGLRCIDIQSLYYMGSYAFQPGRIYSCN